MSEESSFIHDILTPLAVIQAHVRNLREALNGDLEKLSAADARRRIDRTYEACERLVQLVTSRRSVLTKALEAADLSTPKLD